METAAKKWFINQIKYTLWFFETIFKEIMAKHLRYHHQLRHVNALPLEHLINIRLLTINTLGKPIDCTTLSRQFFLNQVADMHIFHFEIHSLLLLKICSKSKMTKKKGRKRTKKWNQTKSNILIYNKLLISLLYNVSNIIKFLAGILIKILNLRLFT